MVFTFFSLPSLSPAYLPAGCVARVTNDAGRTFNVVLVRQGEAYGLDGCLTHDRVDPLVEWYDATYEGADGFGPRGQFVSQYYLSTLTGQDGWSRVDYRQGSRGLDLMGCEPLWRVSAANVREALAAVERVIGGAL
jgi:hypothetical protein